MATYIEIGNFRLLLWPTSYPSWVSGGRTYWWLGSYSCRSASQHVSPSLLQSEWHPDVLTADPDYVDRWVVTPLLNLCVSLLLMTSFRSMENTGGDGASYLCIFHTCVVALELASSVFFTMIFPLSWQASTCSPINRKWAFKEWRSYKEMSDVLD